MAYNGSLQERATRSELDIRHTTQLNKGDKLDHRAASVFCSYFFASILPRLTDMAREAMRDDEFFRDEAYTIARDTQENRSNSILSCSALSTLSLTPPPLSKSLNRRATPFPFPSSHLQKHFQINSLKTAFLCRPE